ncbi:MAG TPA: LapA family protein [Synergistetes bacterium]|nr:LapA family protein [Synergistota bacterium]
MKSYALAVAMAMLLAAVYAFQNTTEILIRFVLWEVTVPQGIWEVMLFAAGGVLMWLVSIFAMMESRSGYSKKLKEKEARVKELEEERTSLMGALRGSRSGFEGVPRHPENISEEAATDGDIKNA